MLDFDKHIKTITTFDYEQCQFLKELIIKADVNDLIESNEIIKPIYEKLITIQNLQKEITQINEK